jgi:hypothetical protein
MFTIMPQDILLFLSALFIFYKNMCIESVWWGIEKITLFYKNLVKLKKINFILLYLLYND